MQGTPTVAASAAAVPLITPTALNEDVMTQMAAMRIIRRQRLQDLERLNSVVLRFMVSGMDARCGNWFASNTVCLAHLLHVYLFVGTRRINQNLL